MAFFERWELMLPHHPAGRDVQDMLLDYATFLSSIQNITTFRGSKLANPPQVCYGGLAPIWGVLGSPRGGSKWLAWPRRREVWCFEYPRIPSFDARSTLCKFLWLSRWHVHFFTPTARICAFLDGFCCKLAQNDRRIKAVPANTTPNHFQFLLGVVFGKEVSQ